MLRHAVGIPNFGDYGDPRRLADLARRAEAAGWDGFFVWDHLVYRDTGWPVADPYIALAAVALATERLRVGVMVTPLSRRRPHRLARETTTLDHLSGGRLVVGLGLGANAHHEFAAFGEVSDDRERAQRLDEGLEILAGLWSGEPFSFAGRHFQVEETTFQPPPVQRPRPPVWIAGRWPARRPFRRAARWDGAFPTHRDVGRTETMTAAQVREVVEFVNAQRDDPTAPFDFVIEGLSDPAPQSAERVAAYADAGLTWWIEKLGWFRGGVEDVVRRIEYGPPRG